MAVYTGTTDFSGRPSINLDWTITTTDQPANSRTAVNIRLEADPDAGNTFTPYSSAGNHSISFPKATNPSSSGTWSLDFRSPNTLVTQLVVDTNRFVPYGSGTTANISFDVDGGGSTLGSASGSVTIDLFGASSTVPNVIGLGPGDASIAISDAGFVPQETGTLSTTDPGLNNTVATQSPAGGTSAAAGSTVSYTVYVYTEPTLTVPNVENALLSNAIATLEANGFTNIQSTPTTVGATINNNLVVFDTDPEPGVSQTAGTLINLDYYDYRLTFPNVVGQYLSAATATIQGTQFTDAFGISTSTRTTGATIANNRTVFSQSPTGNTSANIADPISLTLYEYRVTMPNLVGQTEAAALTSLRNLGWEYTSNTTDFRRITINYITAGATGANNGTVASQSPASGATNTSVATAVTTLNVYRVPGAGQRFTSPTARTLMTTTQRYTGTAWTGMTIRRVFKNGAWTDISNT